MKAFTTKELIELTFAVVHPIVGAILGGIILSENMDPWYHELIQPAWVPPEWSFTPIWTIVYCSIGFATYIAYRKVVASASGWDKYARVALFVYVVQLIINWAYTPIFLGLMSLKWVMSFWFFWLDQWLHYLSHINYYYNLPKWMELTFKPISEFHL